MAHRPLCGGQAAVPVDVHAGEPLRGRAIHFGGVDGPVPVGVQRSEPAFGVHPAAGLGPIVPAFATVLTQALAAGFELRR